MKRTFFILLICSFLLNGAAAQKKRPKKNTSPKPTQVQMKDEIIYEPDAEMLREMREKVRVIESKQNWTEFNRQSPIVNPAQTRSAYAAKFKMESDAENLIEVVVVHDSPTNKFYEIRGIEDFPWRPFSDFRWISDDVLQFEQWVNPNNGGRYRVDLKTGKIVAAGYVRSN